MGASCREIRWNGLLVILNRPVLLGLYNRVKQLDVPLRKGVITQFLGADSLIRNRSIKRYHTFLVKAVDRVKGNRKVAVVVVHLLDLTVCSYNDVEFFQNLTFYGLNRCFF